MPPSGFGRRLQEMRAAAGLTQQAVATAAGLTQPELARYERGDCEPGWPTVLALASALRRPADDFMPATGSDVRLVQKFLSDPGKVACCTDPATAHLDTDQLAARLGLSLSRVVKTLEGFRRCPFTGVYRSLRPAAPPG